MKNHLKKLTFWGICSLIALQVVVGDNIDEISKKLSNPLSNIHSLSLRNDADQDVGTNYGSRDTLKIQPVLSFDLNGNWSILSKTSIPLITQHDVMSGSTQNGVGDIQQTFYFTPKTKTKISMGFGPMFSIPTYDNNFSSKRYGAGPALVILATPGKWTLGALANHIWSFAGPGTENDKGYYSRTLIQPFATYHLPKGWSVGINSESTYEWDTRELTVPILLQVNKVIKINDLPMSFGIAPEYYAVHPDNGARWGVRGLVTFVF